MATTREVLDERVPSSAERRLTVIETTPEAEARTGDAAPPEIVLDIERHTPDGAGVSAHECRWMPLVMAGLALAGITVVAVVLGVSDGWRAGLLGAGAVVTGCAVGWIVVWGAGLMRRREEQQISHEVEDFVLDRPPR
jgi:hypothetical protein